MRRQGSSTRVHGRIGIPGWGAIPLRRCPSVNWVEGTASVLTDCTRIYRTAVPDPSPRHPQLWRRGRLVGEAGHRSRRHRAVALDFNLENRMNGLEDIISI
jgi:hypothetical protein